MTPTDPVEIFRVEAQDLLERIEQGLLDLEKTPEDEEIIASVFRALHTLKGAGAMFGFDALAAFTHHCETAFDRVRKHDAKATPELIGAVLSALDHMRALAEGGPASESEESSLLAVLQSTLSQPLISKNAPPTKPVRAETAGFKTWHIRYAPPLQAFINGERPICLFRELQGMGKVSIRVHTENIPFIENIAPTECYLFWDIELTTESSRSEIEAVFIFMLDFVTISDPVGDGSNVGVETSAIPSTDPIAGEVSSVPTDIPDAPDAVEKTDVSEPLSVQKNDIQKNRDSGTLRVPADRLDELMDRVAELVIAQSRLKQVSAGSNDINLRSVAEEIERLASELRDSMMFVRMVPIAQLFGRFRRLIHDLSRDMGKAIEFTTEGESTELDKTVIERLADPMIHLIRNSADHGLETPDERRAAGKPDAGRITLSARQSGGEVIVSVLDDGKGINCERVRAKAEANGLIAKGASMSEAELLQLIFRPGFSTAAKVTNVSGRGVGMDVVKRTIEGLRGSIDISSSVGKGSRVDLRIPLTLAIIDGLLVRVGTNRYVIPLASVEECVELSREQDLRSSGRCFLTLRDALVPFIRLRNLFKTEVQADSFQKIVVVSTGAERVGLVVDQIVGQHQTVIKPLSRFHSNVHTFSGATILGDGSVALILDIGHLVTAGQMVEERLSAVG